jgi:hypothetical protein
MYQVHKVAALLAEQLGTPRALTTEILWRYGEIAQLQELRTDPSNYLDATSYHKDVIATDFVRKCAFPGSKDRLKQAAVDGFLACEKRNWKTNERLYRFVDNYGLTPNDQPVMLFIEAWRKEVASLLGPLPSNLTPQFSGGSTASDRGHLTTVPDKMTSHPSYYPESLGFLSLWWETAWGRACAASHGSDSERAAIHPKVVRSNVFFTVPKDGQKDRGCCMEASLSLSYQLAVGKVFRSRLRTAYGNDLQRGQDKHRILAQQASIDGRRATVDLTDASNLLARALPELILPYQWFELVNSLRAPMVNIDGREYRLEMFSSMGNGFTFELETLVFHSLARTILKLNGAEDRLDEISVYGDDIIIPTEFVSDFLSALSYFGFVPNKRKTFVTGPFRESCGGDYFDGTPVRASYLKELPTEPQHWISLANSLWRLPQQWASRARMECLKNIPATVRSCQGPEALGDICLHGPVVFHNTKVFIPRPQHQSCWHDGEKVAVTHYRVYRPVAQPLPWHYWYPDVQLASALAGVGEDGPVPRNGVSGYKLDWVPAPGNAWLPTSRL